MNIIHTHTLSLRETEALAGLTNQCREADGLTLSFPTDGNDYWILEDECGNTAAYFAAYAIDEGLWECYAFTRPDYRGKKCFSKLLDLACDYSQRNGDPVLSFVTDGRCLQALQILEHLKATYSHSEYMMCLSLSSPVEDQGAMDKMVLNFRREPDNCQEEYGEEELITVLGWPDGWSQSSSIFPGIGDTWDSSLKPPAVTCRIVAQGNKVYLFSLETRPEYRRQGMARRFIARLVQVLEHAAYDTLFLQVSDTNEAALSLYRKTGFRITETLSYYLY